MIIGTRPLLQGAQRCSNLSKWSPRYRHCEKTSYNGGDVTIFWIGTTIGQILTLFIKKAQNDNTVTNSPDPTVIVRRLHVMEAT